MNNLINSIRIIVDEADYMRNAYFWDSPCNASSRRSYEKRHSHDEVKWSEGGHEYTAEFQVSCSCKNVYAKGYYTKDGKRTTLTAIRNSLARLESATV